MNAEHRIRAQEYLKEHYGQFFTIFQTPAIDLAMKWLCVEDAMKEMAGLFDKNADYGNAGWLNGISDYRRCIDRHTSQLEDKP